MFKKITYTIHQVLGTAVSLLFLMWFITGLVLVYHPFPDATAEEKNRGLETITDTLPPLQNVLSRIAHTKDIKGLKLQQRDGQTFFTYNLKKEKINLAADSTKELPPITQSTLANVAQRMAGATIAMIDTLHEQDVWTMYTKYANELPIYKLYLSNEENHQLYISSKSGEVQQYTSASQRFWAYVGSIPHKFYVPVLRKHTQLWIDVLSATSFVVLLAVLSGIIVGIRAYMKSKKGKLVSPYRKVWYKWHHVAGMVFGFFLLTWAISGVFSLKKAPQWIAKTHTDYKVPSKIKGIKLGYEQYKLDYRTLKEKYADLKEVEWAHFQNVPIYNIVVGENNLCIDASSNKVKELFLTEENVERAIKNIHGDSVQFTLSFIEEYEEYYIQWRRDVLLPAYKIEVQDADNSTYYINPQTGIYKYVNDNRRARKWLFSAIHYFHIKWLVDRPTLWNITLWTLSLGGIIVSASGVWLSVRFLKRKILKLKKRNTKCRKEKS